MKKSGKISNRPALTVGLTGPAGCGKSYIRGELSKITNTLIIDTDSIARVQMQKGGVSYEKVVKFFGEEILLENGEIDRPKLAGIVFNDEAKLKKLNHLTHPPVIKECKKLIEDGKNKYSLIILESAILTESGCDVLCDETWYVYSTRAERARRLSETRGYDDARIRSVFKSQSPDSFYKLHADEIIENRDGVSSEELSKKLRKLLQKKMVL